MNTRPCHSFSETSRITVLEFYPYSRRVVFDASGIEMERSKAEGKTKSAKSTSASPFMARELDGKSSKETQIQDVKSRSNRDVAKMTALEPTEHKSRKVSFLR